MMNSNKTFLLVIIGYLYLSSAISSFAQETDPNEAATDGPDKPAIILVPLGRTDVPSYIPMIVDRLFEAKIDKTEAYSIFTREELAAILKENDITLPQSINEETALEIGERLGMDQVLFGDVTSENSEFVIKTKIMDVETGTVISKDTEKADNIKGLEEAVGKLTRSILQTVLPEEVVAEAVKTLDEAEQTDKEADVEDSITAFEKLVEENPEEALEMVGEPVREALKETVREEIVDEEIQTLFDQAKEEQALIKKRKQQLLLTIGLESAVQLGNIFGAMAADQRIMSIKNWYYYMNNLFWTEPYDRYNKTFSAYMGLEVSNFLFTTGGSLWMGYNHLNYPGDLLSLSGMGRGIFKISYLTNIAGNLVSVFSNSQGFRTQRKFLDYMNAQADFTELYEDYRDSDLIYSIARISKYSLWGLGYGGMIASSVLAKGDNALVPSSKAKRIMAFGSGLLGIGNLTSGIAVNYYAQAEESRISEESPSGGAGESVYKAKHLTADILSYSSYLLYAGSGFLVWYALSLPLENDNSVSGNDELAFSIVPAANGISAVVRLRME